MEIQLPRYAAEAIRKLNNAGHEAYAVGGCVRDSVLGKQPADWDITTSALPEEVQKVFEDYRVIPTGVKHGTVTVLLGGGNLEITTYRTEAGYSDHRHPDSVFFTRSLAEDLKRRDFTINALAYHPDRGIVDLYSGMADLAAGRIVCVGDPEQRFTEDALRILRALRFAAQFGFSIEPVTDRALRRMAPLLRSVSAERCCTEISKLLCTDHVREVLYGYPAVLGTIIPELLPMVGLAQCNPYHHLTVYEHTAETVAAIAPLLPLRLTMLLHDCGKPQCYTRDQDGIDHFHGHAAISTALTEQVLARLRFDNATAEIVRTLILHHDDTLSPTTRCAKHLLARFGERNALYLIAVQKADVMGQHPDKRSRTADLDELERQIRELIAAHTCVSLDRLAVSGKDLMEIGYKPGKRLGDTLRDLLEMVIDNRCPNEKASLLRMATQQLRDT